MSALTLLIIAVAGVAVLLLAVIKFKIPAFLALLTVSILVAIAAGIPLDEVVTSVQAGLGGTLGSVAILVGLGAMLGKMIELSGGAEALAGKFTKVLGPKRVTAALTAAAFLLAIPVFFDVGFIILVPIVYGFAKAAGVNPLKIGLPVAAMMLAVHVVVPPHPGVVGGAGVIGSDIGWITIIGLAITAFLGVPAYFTAKWLNRRDYPMLPTMAEQFRLFGSGTSEVELESGAGGTAVKTKTTVQAPPSPAMIIALIVLPVLMIMLGTVSAVVLPEGSASLPALTLIGSPVVALLVTVFLAFIFLGIRRGWSASTTGEVMDAALAPAAIVILVTGAGGAFGKVLTESGIGAALADTLSSAGLPILLMGYLLAAVLRAAQGSATVAIVTTAGLLAASVGTGDYSALQMALITVAIGFGAFGFSHVNDSGFWIVTRYLGLSVADGLKTWTVLTTILGLCGFMLTSLLWLVLTPLAG